MYLFFSLYKWTGIQFVEVNNILTIAANSIAYFKNENSYIFVITQTPSDAELVFFNCFSVNFVLFVKYFH